MRGSLLHRTLKRFSFIREKILSISVLHLLVIIITLSLTALYLWGAFQQADKVNTNLNKSDQGAYMNYAKNTVESNYSDIGGRNRMPIYPLLLSSVYSKDLSDEVFFQRAKLFNIGLSVIALAIVAFVCLRFLSRLYTFSLISIFAFTIDIFKAGFVQAEILFYLLQFLSFLLVVLLIRQPNFKLAIATGILIAVAHLTKASIIPLLILGVVFLLIQQFIIALRNTKSNGRQRVIEIAQKMIPASANVGLLLLFFFITIFPYIQNSKQRFGHYFYNVNSTFYFWYDSWEEAKEGTKAFGDRAGWPDMPDEEIPSLQNYLRDHSLRDIVDRLSKGVSKLWRTAFSSYGYLSYGAIYVLSFMSLMIFQYKKARQAFQEHIGLALFFISYFIAFLLLSAWFVPIATLGNRIILAHFLPMMFLLSFIFSRSNYWFSISVAKKLDRINAGVLLILPFDIYQILTSRIFAVYGGK